MKMFTFSVFRPEYRFFVFLFGSKTQSSQFKLKFGTKTNSNSRFSGGLPLFCFRLEIPFLCKFGPKNQCCQFKLKFCTNTNSNMQTSMVVFLFFVLDWKHLSWANLVQKIKTVSFKMEFRT